MNHLLGTLALLSVLVGCMRRPADTPVPPAHSAAPIDSAIYAVVLDSLNRRGGGLPLSQTYSSLRINGTAFAPGGLRERLGADTIAFLALAGSAERVRPSLPEILVAWRRASWFDRDTVYGARRRDGTGSIYFIMGLSPIGFNADSTRAALLVETICGGLCGGGDIVVLERVASRWRIRGVHDYFVR